MGDVAKALGKQWQEVDEKLKKSYQEKGEIEKQKYNKVSFLLIENKSMLFFVDCINKGNF